MQTADGVLPIHVVCHTACLAVSIRRVVVSWQQQQQLVRACGRAGGRTDFLQVTEQLRLVSAGIRQRVLTA